MFEHISDIFGTIADVDDIQTFGIAGSGDIRIHLPKLKLDFRYKPGEDKIFSLQLEGAHISRDQNLDTLTGLKNMLVLTYDDEAKNDVLLVPEGKLIVSRRVESGFSHIDLYIFGASSYHVYDIDRLMGTLKSNGDLQSNLFLATLHAYTSSCSIDPFTCRTGTQQAVHILTSSEVQSAREVSEQHFHLMKALAELSPGRIFGTSSRTYGMIFQTWSDELSPLSQDGGFHSQIIKLLRCIQSTSFSVDTATHEASLLRKKIEELSSRVHFSLQRRDNIRLSVFRGHGFGGECHSIASDALYSSESPNPQIVVQGYQPPDKSAPPGRGTSIATMQRVRNVGRSVAEKKVQQTFQGDLCTQMRQLLQNTDGTWGPTAAYLAADFAYSSRWLQDRPETSYYRHWCPIHQALQSHFTAISNHDKRMWISCVAFTASTLKDQFLLNATIALLVHNETRNVQIPGFDRFFLFRTGTPNEKAIRKILAKHQFTFADSRRPSIPSTTKAAYEEMQKRKLDECAQALFSHYMDRTHETRRISPALRIYLRIEPAQEKTTALLDRWLSRGMFEEYLRRLQDAITNADVAVFTGTVKYLDPALPFTHSTLHPPTSMSCGQILSFHQPPTLASTAPLQELLGQCVQESQPADTALAKLIESLECMAGEETPKLDYVNALRRSSLALQTTYTKLRCIEDRKDPKDLYKAMVRRVQGTFTHMFTEIVSALRRPIGDGPVEIAVSTHFRTDISIAIVLQQLHHTVLDETPALWKDAIIQLALMVTDYQQAVRLASADLREVEAAELAGIPARTWCPQERPYWLLFEVHNNLRIRPCQVAIAESMLKQCENGVLQLNMGEGKTSVIFPIVAMALANGESIARIITVKQQEKQARRTLVSCLGGICNRSVYSLPFSRRTQLEQVDVAAIDGILETCKTSGAIFLSVPEYQLSMELTSRSLMIDNDNHAQATGHQLMSLLTRTKSNFCDIVDESDETFSPKFELIYTNGHQHPIDFAPKRWHVIQSVLGLVETAVKSMVECSPDYFEYIATSPEQYIRIRFLNQEASEMIEVAVANAIEQGDLAHLVVPYSDDEFCGHLLSFLMEETPSLETVNSIFKREYSDQTTVSTLLLLRGLLACGVLDFSFRLQRWRVNYGLDVAEPPRTDLAIPYAAKDIPKARAEFSHDDSIIILTCLSYYYRGLSIENFFTCMEHLKAEEDGADVYGRWVAALGMLTHGNYDCSVPKEYRSLISINLRERAACINALYPRLRYYKATIDYFLAELIFPKQMRTFPHKFTCSGWDIASVKERFPVRGFSGTKDSQTLLPLGMKQIDNEEHMHTDALVLSNLLNEDNEVVLLGGASGEGVRDEGITTEELIVKIATHDAQCRVMIDVAAHIVDLTNQEAASIFLRSCEESDEVEVAVFFGQSGELLVIDRNDTIQPFYSSRYQRQMNHCVVFLDQAHSRGTDLPFPHEWNAAVILGTELTKDRLAQACMRMRKLGQGQSIVYLVPEEIERKIRLTNGMDEESPIHISNIIRWTVAETWLYLERTLPLWAVQGRRYEFQKSVMTKQANESITASDIKQLLEKEERNVMSRYMPNTAVERVRYSKPIPNTETTKAIQARCDAFGLDLAHSEYREEQERELAPEIEEEHYEEPQEPPKAAMSGASSDLLQLIKTGHLPEGSHPFLGAFRSLKGTSAAKLLDVKQFPRHLRVTLDFANTVEDSSRADLFQRPVRWVLTVHKGTQKATSMIIISPFEANIYKHEIMKSKHVFLHMYAPRQSLRAGRLDELKLNTIPKLPTSRYRIPQQFITALNLFAGQLFFSSFDEYIRVCDYLDLSWNINQTADCDGFKRTPHSQLNSNQCKFDKSPIRFLRQLMENIRRHGSDISKTHMGRLLNREKLSSTDIQVLPSHRPDDDDDNDGGDDDKKDTKKKIKLDHSEFKTENAMVVIDLTDVDVDVDMDMAKVEEEDVKKLYTAQGIKIEADDGCVF